MNMNMKTNRNVYFKDEKREQAIRSLSDEQNKKARFISEISMNKQNVEIQTLSHKL